MLKVFFILFFSFSSSLFAQDLPYKLSFQDRGPVFRHETCRLVVYNGEVGLNKRDNPGAFGAEYLNSSLTEFLALKGYSVLNMSGSIHIRGERAVELKKNDLSLKLDTYKNGKRSEHSGVLGYLRESNNYNSKVEVIKELKPFTSPSFKLSKNAYTYHFISKKRKAREALFDLFESLPDCISLDSGHFYEEEKYNKDIVLDEINSCLSLYNENKRRIKKYQNGYEKILTGTASVLSMITAVSITPLAWPVAGGFVGFHGIKHFTTKSLDKKLDSSSVFLNAVKSCYLKILNGKDCEKKSSSSYMSSFEIQMSYLSEKDREEMEDLLSRMTETELVQKIANYLGSTKACSKEASRVRKILMNKIIKETKKTI